MVGYGDVVLSSNLVRMLAAFEVIVGVMLILFGVSESLEYANERQRIAIKKAACAVAASLLTAIYHILKDGVEHRDLGAAYLDHRRSTENMTKLLLAQLAKRGYHAELKPLAEAA